MNTKTKKSHRASYPAPSASSAPAKATWKKRPAPVVGGRRNVIERRRPGAARGPSDAAAAPAPAAPTAPTLAERAQAAEAARRAAAEAKKADGSDKPWWKRKAPVVGGSNPRPKPPRPHQTRPAAATPAANVDEAFDGSDDLEDDLDDLAGELE